MNPAILIINATILSMTDTSAECIENGFVAIKGGVISGLGSMTDLPDQTEGGITIDGRGKLVMPGLINTHTHAPMTLFRGMADDLPVMTWLTEHIFPAEARSVNEDMVYWCTKLAAAEMILSGTTTVADGYFLEDKVAEAFIECGIRSVAAQGIIDFPAPGVPDPAENVAVAERFIDRFRSRGNLITPAVFCHSPYTCSPETLKKAKDMARKKNARFFIHLAETMQEVEQLREQQGAAPVHYLNNLGILDSKTTCIHCIWLEDDEIEILSEKGVTISICPQSNMKLGSGIAQLDAMLEAGISVGMGTDSCASNNSLDLFVEMDLCAKLHKVKDLDPTALPARNILAIATIIGADCLGLADTIGSISPGKRADLIMVDLMQPHLQHIPAGQDGKKAAGGADVSTVIVDGRLIMQDRNILTFDVNETMAKVRELADGLK